MVMPITDGSPFGYVAWYKQSIETAKLKPLRPSADRQGIQRMGNAGDLPAMTDTNAGKYNISKQRKKNYPKYQKRL